MIPPDGASGRRGGVSFYDKGAVGNLEERKAF